MLATIPEKIYQKWQQYFLEEPWGEVRDDLRFGLLGCLVEDLVRGEEAALEPKDFVISYVRDPEEEARLAEAEKEAEALRLQIFALRSAAASHVP